MMIRTQSSSILGSRTHRTGGLQSLIKGHPASTSPRATVTLSPGLNLLIIDLSIPHLIIAGCIPIIKFQFLAYMDLTLSLDYQLIILCPFSQESLTKIAARGQLPAPHLTIWIRQFGSHE